MRMRKLVCITCVSLLVSILSLTLAGCTAQADSALAGSCCSSAGPSVQSVLADSNAGCSKTGVEPADCNVPAAASDRSRAFRSPRWLRSAETDLLELPGRIWTESGRTFSRPDNRTLLLLAGAASIVLHNTDADDSIQDNVRHHHLFHNWLDEPFNVIGSPATHFPATGLWYILAAQNQDELNKQRAWTMMTALSVNGLVTLGLKAARDNTCPNGAKWAWPSGHTSSSFTLASVLDEFYGPRVGVPAYILAGLVAYRMVDTDDHWTSDVIFGATLGWVVGHTIAAEHKKQEKLCIAGFEVLPYIGSYDRPVFGISLLKRF